MSGVPVGLKCVMKCLGAFFPFAKKLLLALQHVSYRLRQPASVHGRPIHTTQQEPKVMTLGLHVGHSFDWFFHVAMCFYVITVALADGKVSIAVHKFLLLMAAQVKKRKI